MISREYILSSAYGRSAVVRVSAHSIGDLYHELAEKLNEFESMWEETVDHISLFDSKVTE